MDHLALSITTPSPPPPLPSSISFSLPLIISITIIIVIIIIVVILVLLTIWQGRNSPHSCIHMLTASTTYSVLACARAKMQAPRRQLFEESAEDVDLEAFLDSYQVLVLFLHPTSIWSCFLCLNLLIRGAQMILSVHRYFIYVTCFTFSWNAYFCYRFF